MMSDLLTQLEQKIAKAIEAMDFMRLQIETLEEENANLKSEQEKWRHELMALIARFDAVDEALEEDEHHAVATDEECMTV